MSKLQRKSAKLFAEDATAAAGGIAQFGSLAEGTPNYSTDPDVIQALDAYKDGWSSAVLGTKSPALEDRNALDYLLSYQQAYIMQRGIPEYLDTETYYQGSFASKADGKLYVSKVDNNVGHDPELDTTETYWMKFPTPQELAAKVSKSGDTMSGDLSITKSNAAVNLTNSNSKVYAVMANNNGNFDIKNADGSGKGFFLNGQDNEAPYYNDGTNSHKLIYQGDKAGYGFPNYGSGIDYSSYIGNGDIFITESSGPGWFVFSQNTGNYAAAEVKIYATHSSTTPAVDAIWRLYNDNNVAIFPVAVGNRLTVTSTFGGTLLFFPCL